MDHIVQSMPYCFCKDRSPRVPAMELREVWPGKKFTIGDLEIMPLRVMHGNLPILGYRIGGLTYITDMKSMDEETFKLLEGTETLVVNALHTKEHPTHQNVRQAVLFAERVGAKETYFIHMSHRAGLHAVMNGKFPAGVQFAYDGLVVEIDLYPNINEIPGDESWADASEEQMEKDKVFCESWKKKYKT